MSEKTPWTNRDILTATGGKIRYGREDVYQGVTIDSRTARPGQLFVALRGKTHDGHLFIEKALRQGVRGLLVEQDYARKEAAYLEGIEATCIEVDDTTRALGRLGRFRRRLMGLPVVAITGTNGKTTTREMTTGILARHFRVLAPAGNYNNEIGVPLTLLRLEKDHQVGVLELGMNAPGEIKRLAGICEPDIGVVLNVSAGHLEGLGNIEGVAAAKSELVAALGDKSAAVLNADDPRVLGMADKACARVVTYGRRESADVRAVRMEKKAPGLLIGIEFPGRRKSLSVQLSSGGEHMISNALAAATVGFLLDIQEQDIKAALEDFGPVAGRLVVTETAAGFTIVDDTYNANPDSAAVAIDELVAAYGGGRRILVFGDMLELGEHAREMHREIGHLAAARGIDKIFAAGEFAGEVAEGARLGGMSPAAVAAGSKAAITRLLLEIIRPGDRVLVKGSRGMAMETVVVQLMELGQDPGLTEKG
ncbi:MAG: UDP-N-acetylmuramoyl-tripeptide--D-alanyl-D-alanine ligase [Desulfosudaceae bacterium]